MSKHQTHMTPEMESRLVENAELQHALDMDVVDAIAQALNRRHPAPPVQIDMLDTSAGTGETYIDLEADGRPYRLRLERA